VYEILCAVLRRKPDGGLRPEGGSISLFAIRLPTGLNATRRAVRVLGKECRIAALKCPISSPIWKITQDSCASALILAGYASP
jgi:hypothetical protein